MVKIGMTAEKHSSSSITSDVTSHQNSIASNSSGMSDGSQILITGHKLNGNNYLQWSQSVMMFLCGKGKDDYLSGVAAPPKADDPKFRSWKSENSMVMSWLINSMTNEIGENFLLYGTAREFWEAVRETYSNKENTSELFEIESILHDLQQGDMTVTQYFNTLTRYWQQVDMCEEHSWKCPEDGVKYRQIVEKKRVYKFLFGLNKNLDEVRGRIQGMRPQLSLRDAFSEVRREESRKKVMLRTQAITPQLENSALAARTDTRQRKERPYCEHCRKLGHTKETCWKIHGKPADWKPSRPQNRGNTAVREEDSVSAESNLFSKEQLEILKQLIQQSQAANSTQTIGTGSLAHKGLGFGEDDWQC